MKSKLTLFAAVLIFAAGLTTYVLSVKRESNSPFVVTFSHFREGGNPATSQKWIQKVNSSGQSLVNIYTADGKELPQFVPGYPSGLWEKHSSSAFLESHREYVGQNEILGFKVYCFRAEAGEGMVVERWFAPQTGPVALKTIISMGSEKPLITEATSIEFREVSDEEVTPQVSSPQTSRSDDPGSIFPTLAHRSGTTRVGSL